MGHRILVADDSLTVQKVVSITLASYDYELVEIRDETQLNEQLMKGEANLLLLDLNLSESKTGYDIAKEVRSKMSDLPIVLLLGTFDSVDEAAFEQCGINDRIVKPFESNQFIQKVQSLLENSSASTAVQAEDSTVFSGETESNFLDSNLEDVTPSVDEEIDNNGDDWVVDSPAPVDKSEDNFDSYSVEESADSGNALEASLEGWGMSVPGTIGATGKDADMIVPDVISEKVVAAAEAELEIVHQEEEKLPNESDLDYPDVGEPEVEPKEQSVFEEVDHQPTSALLADDNFDLEVSEEKADLAAQIDEDESADDFWAADDSGEGATVVSPSLEDEIEEEEEEEYFAEPDEEVSLEPLGDPRGNAPFELSESPSVTTSQPSAVNTEEIVEKIIAELKPTLNDLVEKHCKETIENVAWQIIPDLAENLIRNEIKEIKESSV